MAVYTFSLSVGSQFGPLKGGYLIAARGWCWFFYRLVILIAVNLALVTLTIPETTHKRIYLADETAADYEEKTSGPKHVEAVESVEGNDRALNLEGFSYFKNVLFVRHHSIEGGAFKKLLYLAALPLGFILVPAALFTTILYGIVLGWVIVIPTLVLTLFSPPPYLFTSTQIGLFSLASFIGTLISFLFTGIFTDNLSSILRKRNGGIHKPEHRLPAMILLLLICPAGVFLFGYSVNRKDKYIFPAVDFALQSTGRTMVPSILLSYVVDSFPDTSGEALVLINAGKNFIAFGLTLKASPWLIKSGVKIQFIEMASIEQGLILIFGLILLFFWPWLRNLARHSRILSPFHAERS